MQCSSSRHITVMRSFASFTSVCQPTEIKKETKNLFQQLKVMIDIHYQTTLFILRAEASWIVCSPPDQVVQVRAMLGNTALCSWARHFTLTVPLSTQVYEWVPANIMVGLTLQRTSIPSGEEQKYSQSLHAGRNQDTLRPDGRFGLQILP